MFEKSVQLDSPYGGYWKKAKEVFQLLKQIEETLSPELENPFEDKIDNSIQQRFREIRAVANDCIYDVYESFEPDETPN